ncbi:hypothetical protein H5410_027507 [Solanum commersonii]|uniref:Uncharacterized protein n=1 Tax=Solanum commersonii TaxID=4109 RepID=A0A9J5Z271_SOLCO|nr:hypothetical protein H5410_027507 [Solanum commersonii]
MNSRFLLLHNESELTPHQLTRRKRRLINVEFIALSIVSFAIVPLAGETNIYTIKLNKGEDLVDPFRLSQKYHDILDGWTCEKRWRTNGQCDKVYYHMKKRSICRSIMDVCRYILDGYEKMEVEVDSDTNMVKEIKKEETKRITNLDCHEVVVVLQQEVDKLYCVSIIFSYFYQRLIICVGKECSRYSKFDKLSSSNVSVDVLHLMSPLFEEVQNTSFANLELQNVVPKDKVHREINDHVVVTLAKNEELTINFSYNEENIEQVPISQSLEIENNDNTHMEKGLPYEDNYGEKEMTVNLTNNVKFVTAVDFTLDTDIFINSEQMHEIITRFMQLGCV